MIDNNFEKELLEANKLLFKLEAFLIDRKSRITYLEQDLKNLKEDYQIYVDLKKQHENVLVVLKKKTIS